MMRFLLIAALLGGLPAGSGAGPLISRESHPAINWQSLDDFATAHGGLEGQRLTVLGPWLGADRDMFNAVLAHFAEATGAVAHYSGSDSFEQQVVIGAEAGAPPDIAMFPQPGLAADLAREGKLVPLD
ncbi:MAG: extracellular solute-binding protein, partial [Paracoccus sp. (in: a-proteobacteria)]|nr:extracellular solute-binding protein [Paracoccus sp. (in: a-proteobacteria)]